VRCGKKKIEVKLMKKKNQKREEEEKERRLSSSVSEEKHKIGNETRNTTSSTTPTTSLDGVGDEGKTTSLDKPPADKWTRLEFLGEMEEELETLDGEDGLNKMFQDLYKDADDDQRRAMMKSFVESNGTVLSTDWTDVGKKFVEPQAP
jgi:suppressor of G2 allele of SKP1